MAPKEEFKPGNAILDLNFAVKNCLTHNLHGCPDKDTEKKSCKENKRRGKLVDSETWSKCLVTSNGKPATEALNRVHIWLSTSMGAVENLDAITRHYGPEGNSYVQPL